MHVEERGERNKALFRKFHDEVIVGGDLDLGARMQRDDLLHLRGAIGDTLAILDPNGVRALKALRGGARFREATRLLRSYFPKWDSVLHEVWGEGDRSIAMLTIHGSFKGRFLDVGPENPLFALDQLVIVQWDEEGRQKAIYAMSDQLDFWRQLGAPLPGPELTVTFAESAEAVQSA